MAMARLNGVAVPPTLRKDPAADEEQQGDIGGLHGAGDDLVAPLLAGGHLGGVLGVVRAAGRRRRLSRGIGAFPGRADHGALALRGEADRQVGRAHRAPEGQAGGQDQQDHGPRSQPAVEAEHARVLAPVRHVRRGAGVDDLLAHVAGGDHFAFGRRVGAKLVQIPHELFEADTLRVLEPQVVAHVGLDLGQLAHQVVDVAAAQHQRFGGVHVGHDAADQRGAQHHLEPRSGQPCLRRVQMVLDGLVQLVSCLLRPIGVCRGGRQLGEVARLVLPGSEVRYGDRETALGHVGGELRMRVGVRHS
ncbi:hypothetical protein AFL94_10130 [Arthrobacter sp. LS16]|nr:hypothetical protein AFL94_10130 [Arthrobacter sp. LS16]